MKGKSESEVAQLCPTLRDPMDCSLPGSSIHGIFQARVRNLYCSYVFLIILSFIILYLLLIFILLYAHQVNYKLLEGRYIFNIYYP